jgi:ribulose-phosphate 3-epimerase
MKLYPSILTSSIDEYRDQLSLVVESNAIEVVQVDVIDGSFADNLTLSPLDMTNIEYDDLTLDFHLMADEPMDFVQEIVSIKEDLPVRAVIAQVERMSHQDDYCQEVKNNNWQVGLSLDLHTPVEAIDPESWDLLDVVQIMTIEAGFQGQKFNQQALKKIESIRQLAKKKVEIIVDGGVKEELIQILDQAGVNGVVMGSALWQAADPVLAISKYSQLLNQTESD